MLELSRENAVLREQVAQVEGQAQTRHSEMQAASNAYLQEGRELQGQVELLCEQLREREQEVTALKASLAQVSQ